MSKSSLLPLLLAASALPLAAVGEDSFTSGTHESSRAPHRRARHVVHGPFLDELDAKLGSRQIVLSEARGSSTGDWTGHRIWPVTVVLLQHLQHKFGEALRGFRVLELGCGLPLLSACLASLGARVCATDLPEMLPHVEACLVNSSGATLQGLTQAARSRLNLRPLIWGDSQNLSSLCGFDGPADLVIGADLVYDANSIEPLYQTLVDTILANDATAILALQPRRFPQRAHLEDPQKIAAFVRRFSNHPAGWAVEIDRPSNALSQQLGEGVQRAMVVTITPSKGRAQPGTKSEQCSYLRTEL